MAEVKLKTGQPSYSLLSAAQQLDAQIRQQGALYAPADQAGLTVGMESMSAVQLGQFTDSLESRAKDLKELFAGVAQEAQPSAAQLAAGALISMALGNPATYSAESYKVSPAVGSESIHVVHPDGGGSAGGYGYTDKVSASMEAFSNETLKKFGAVSVMYNIQAPRQDAFCERLFRTVTVTPENGGIDISVNSMVVFNHFLHDPKGTRADFGRQLLLRAAMDAKILSDESTRLVPEVLDGENEDLFVPAAAVAPETVVVGKREILTAPVAVGVTYDLMGVASSTLIRQNGQLDNTDGMDRMVSVDNIYLQHGDGDVLKFSTRNLPRSLFFKAPQGMDRELTLAFTSRILQLNKKSVLADATAPTNATLKRIVDEDLVVTLEVALDGNVNLETGNIQVDSRPVKVYSVHSAGPNREKLSLKEGTGKAIVDGLAALAVIGYDPNARLTNMNRRERGLQLSRAEYTERYPVLLGAPISFPSPLAENRDAGDMNMLLTAVRTRNSNNAITRLINYADSLERWVNVQEDTDPDNLVPEIEGISRYYVYPWFRHEEVHLPDHIQSIKTSERMADISELLVNLLRSGIWEAYRDSNIQAAMDALTGYSGQKPKVFIGTDSKLSRFIMVQGDTRTIGDGLAFEKYESPDRRIFGDIYYTFITDGEGIDPMNFGSHIWIPELISAVNVSRSNAHYDEAMVQNRSRHVVHLPILGRIRVTGLDEVLKEQVPFPIKSTDSDDTTGGNGSQPGTGGNGTGGGTGTGSDTGAGAGTGSGTP